MQTTPASFSLKNNLFIAMTGKSTLTAVNVKYKSGEELNLAAANNYFYITDKTCLESFFSKFTLAQASGKMLAADPCFNYKGGIFNINATSEIAGAKVGASKWWGEYVEAP